MELKKVLTPWNWFKKEEEQTSKTQNTLPITPGQSPGPAPSGN